MARIYVHEFRPPPETKMPPIINCIFAIYTTFIFLVGFLLGAWVS